MKRPIEAAEIRKGDLIRCEWPPDNATEWRAKVDGPAGWGRSESYYLLDRPEPAVELPTEPTLGWLTSEHGTTLATWRNSPNLRGWLASCVQPDDEPATAFISEQSVEKRSITAFTPATAVPTEALDALRKEAACYSHPDSPTSRFFAAVDEANA